MIPPDLGSLLQIWAGGICFGVGLVAWWRVVGKGFVILGVVVAGVIGGLGAALTGQPVAWAALVLSLTALISLRVAPWALLAAAVTWLGASAGPLGWGAVSGSLALGGVTAEMLLGHWYLIDPRLPRWALRNLALLGLAGVALDLAYALAGPGVSLLAAPGVTLILGLTSLVLLVGVVFSLRVPSYPGVMAATGLSYLAVLTSLGAVSLTRALGV
ncbi:MAG TPA: hypothetical protein VJR05_12900 [Acidimicrobiia bacterium]|nr:hypothetical protein [Acidimicrobiia bacterium]